MFIRVCLLILFIAIYTNSWGTHLLEKNFWNNFLIPVFINTRIYYIFSYCDIYWFCQKRKLKNRISHRSNQVTKSNKVRSACKVRSSPPEVFLGKSAQKQCSKFTGEHPCRSVISMSRTATRIFSGQLFIRTLLQGCFWWVRQGTKARKARKACGKAYKAWRHTKPTKNVGMSGASSNKVHLTRTSLISICKSFTEPRLDCDGDILLGTSFWNSFQPKMTQFSLILP